MIHVTRNTTASRIKSMRTSHFDRKTFFFNIALPFLRTPLALLGGLILRIGVDTRPRVENGLTGNQGTHTLKNLHSGGHRVLAAILVLLAGHKNNISPSRDFARHFF